MSVVSNPEDVKRASQHLRGNLAKELIDGTDRFSNESTLLLKFHGIYQQDDRDLRRQRKQQGLDLAYQCMIRASIPGGVLSAEQWIALDNLADEVGGGSLRITTRQGVQFHFVHKDNLHQLVSTMNRHLVTTLGACGDVVRNVMCCPAPEHSLLFKYAHALAAHLRPKTQAYWELWVDGERAVSASATETGRTDRISIAPRVDTDVPIVAPQEEEPFYGDAYLPRKFKIAFAWPGDNCVDIYTQDTGIIPITKGDEDGFVLLVGGGLGASHADETTHPRLAETLGWVPANLLTEAVSAIVAVQRDYGNRQDRQHARLKYLIESRGIDWFRAEVEGRLGFTVEAAPQLPAWVASEDHLGWHEQPDGRLYLGIHVEQGRIHDFQPEVAVFGGRGCHQTPQLRQKSALRKIAEQFNCEFRLTPRQDLLLANIDAKDRPAIDALLMEHNVPSEGQLSSLKRNANACPALPTCGLALAESERAMPQVIDVIGNALREADIEQDAPHVRMTGCPNGCARPYTAEVGIVGRTKKGYDIWVGGSTTGERLGQRVALNVKLDQLPDLLQPMFVRYRKERYEGETFGDFCNRVHL